MQFIFSLHSLSIIKINECAAQSLNDCHVDAECIDTLKSFECKCKDGFFNADLGSKFNR